MIDLIILISLCVWLGPLAGIGTYAIGYFILAILGD